MDITGISDPRTLHEVLTASLQAGASAGPGADEELGTVQVQREAVLRHVEERLREAEEAKEAALRQADEAKEAALRRHDEARAEMERSYGEEVDRYRAMLDQLRAAEPAAPAADPAEGGEVRKKRRGRRG